MKYSRIPNPFRAYAAHFASRRNTTGLPDAAARTRASARRPARAGITVVEIVVAVMILSVGVGGLLSSSASIATGMGSGARQTVAASIADARIDSLTSLSCATLSNASVASGSRTLRGVTETWSVTDGKNVKNINVTVKIIGRKNNLLYTTVIPCRDT